MIPNCKKDTGWVVLELTDEAKEYCKHRENFEVKIRKINNAVKIVGQIVTIKEIPKSIVTLHLFEIPQEFRSSIYYEVKNTSAFLKAADNGTYLQIPCYIYLSSTHENINMQYYTQSLPTNGTIHIDIDYML